MPDLGHPDLVHAVMQDLNMILQYAQACPDEEVADAAKRILGSQEQGLLQIQIRAAMALALGD